MSIADVPNSMALPQSVQLNLRPNAVPAKRTRLNIQPYTQPGPTNDITSNSLIQFYIPARRNTMYDPQTMYLRGTITGVVSANNRALLNRNAFSVLNRLQVYGQDSTLLEDIQNYNDLCHALMDIQMSREDKYALSTMYGSSPDLQQSATTFQGTAAEIRAAVADATATAALLNARLALATTNLTDNGVRFADANATLDFCIPIVSSFGLLADKMMPVGWLNADLRFDFYTELPNVAFRAHDVDFANPEAVTAYKLANLELVVDSIEFDPSAMAMVSQFAPPTGPLFLHASTYKTYNSSFENGANGFRTTLLPHRSLSVKQVLATSHLPNDDGVDSFARVFPYGGANLQLGLNIGGSKFPQKPISNVAEAFAELQKSQHAFNQLILNGSINRTEYSKFQASASSIANALTCKPVIGFDTEIYDKKGSTIINGQNWTGLNVFIEGNISTNLAQGNLTEPIAGMGGSLSNNYFVNYDVIYVIQDGTISVRF